MVQTHAITLIEVLQACRGRSVIQIRIDGECEADKTVNVLSEFSVADSLSMDWCL